MTTPERPRRTLVTGGARSGKSSFAERSLADEAAVDYIATSEPNPADAEWVARVAAHVARRPANWRTLETLDLETLLTDPGPPVLIDCLGVWLTRVMTDAGCWDEVVGAEDRVRDRIARLAAAFAATQRRVVAVTNEVGSGVVPAYASGRQFRDLQGVLNAWIAAAADDVYLCVAGIPVTVKGRPA